MKNVIVILGATGVGKTDLAISLAKKINGEIISADSMQIYKKLNVGTAKITEKEKQNIPHHLIDIKKFDESYNAWQFVNDCKKILDEILGKNKVPIIVGGTNLYISALTQNYDFGKEKNDEMFKSKFEIKYHLFALNLPREELYNKINQRVDLMISRGLEIEVKNLQKQGLGIEMQAGKSIGYKEFLEHLNGEYSKEFAIDKIKQHSRNFAKRQLTWLRSMPSLTWLDATKKQENMKIILEEIK